MDEDAPNNQTTELEEDEDEDGSVFMRTENYISPAYLQEVNFR